MRLDHGDQVLWSFLPTAKVHSHPIYCTKIRVRDEVAIPHSTAHTDVQFVQCSLLRRLQLSNACLRSLIAQEQGSVVVFLRVKTGVCSTLTCGAADPGFQTSASASAHLTCYHDLVCASPFLEPNARLLAMLDPTQCHV